MQILPPDRFTIDHAQEIYGLSRWSNGYLVIMESGNLAVSPFGDGSRVIELPAVVADLERKGLRTPLLLRFPQLLDNQLSRLVDSFERAREEFEYTEGYMPVFPVKVNQRFCVVDRLANNGSGIKVGLEVGSHAELLAAISMPTSPKSLLVCNGFKDRIYLDAAVLASKMGKEVVVVMEKPFEVDALLELAADDRADLPLIGLRIKLQSRGSGLWEKSGGFASKFGLTTLQMIRCVEKLQRAGLGDRIRFLHFHIGSQITEIRKIKNAIREAAMIYCKMVGLGVDIRYLDVGGGLGVDYDGSRTSSDASVNYTVQEYANDIVFGIKEVCDQEKVGLPMIVSESGRMLSSYHAILVTDIRGAITGIDPEPPDATGKEHQVVHDLAEISNEITAKNYREFYHDALEYRDQLYSLFNLGMIDLRERARGETLFRRVAWQAVRYARRARFMTEEFIELQSLLKDKYICNFSVFQSLPDHWALEQLFPVVPIHRLNEHPNRFATLVDITCDSDGEVDKFIDLKDVKESLELHQLQPGQAYYLGFMLVGAYQDRIGDFHNLFGRVNEAEIVVDEDGRVDIQCLEMGDRARDVLTFFGYNEGQLVSRVERALEEAVDSGRLGESAAGRLLEDYKRYLHSYTYLD